MQLICISRGSYSKGKAFAEALASKLGCLCVGREELLEKATEAGIAAGKLEIACLKSRVFSERLMLEREHFQAFATAYLAERALSGPLVYHGRTGHLLLQRVSHVLRLRVVADMESRITSVEQSLGVDRTRAQKYIDDIEEDRKRWAKLFYNVDWDASSGYDFIINLEHANTENAASSFCNVAQLPEFQETPASRKILSDLLLSSRCRVALASDDRTYNAAFQVRAESGLVSITYLPRNADLAETVPKVLEAVPGVEKILCSVASTRILWLQERFDPKVEVFNQLLDVAQRWDAAIELIRFKATDTPPVIERAPSVDGGMTPSERLMSKGIEDQDTEADRSDSDADDGDNGGLEETLGQLVKAGRSGGRMTVSGAVSDLLSAIDRSQVYTLVVIGETYLKKEKAARIRLVRELGNALHDHLRTAVIQTEELKQQYLVGGRQLVSMLSYFAITIIVYLLVFSNQQPILELLTRTGTSWRIIATVLVALFVPFIAFSYGKATHYLLKLIKME
jgi:hypothetical protein